MEAALNKAREQITLITVLVALLSATMTSFALYGILEYRLNQTINATKIGKLAESNNELSKYLISQEKYQAHFVSIASLIQKHDRDQLKKDMPAIIAFNFVISGILGWIFAKRLLRPVRESYESERRFMQDAAHELRNPLAAMRTTIQQARIKTPSASDTKSMLKALERQTVHLSAMTTDLLLLERNEAPSTSEINITELLDDIIEQLTPYANQNKVKIINKTKPMVKGKIDPQHFIHIAKNLIENAIKFSSPNSEVVVSLNNGGKHWKLKVKDKGIGIPKTEIEKITRRFYRAGNVSATEGTGLGMAIVTKYVELYNGDLKIVSEPEKGTSIEVKF